MERQLVAKLGRYSYRPLPVIQAVSDLDGDALGLMAFQAGKGLKAKERTE